MLERFENPLAVVLWRRAQTYAAKLGVSYHRYNGLDCGRLIQKMQLKMRKDAQYAATGDHHTQNVSSIQRMMALRWL